MMQHAPLVAGWLYAGLLALTPWLASWRPGWAAVAVAGALAVRPLVRRSRAAEPWASACAALSAIVCLAVSAGLVVAAGWCGLGLIVLVVATVLPRRLGARPDAADLLALAGWGSTFVLRPDLMALAAGGWLAPAVLLVAAREVAVPVARRKVDSDSEPLPPSRQARGTLSLRSVVVAGADGLALTVPLDLDLRAGDSLAVVCDGAAEGWALGAVVSGRQAPLEGEVLLDGTPCEVGDRLVAVVAPGESFVAGSLEDNVTVLCDQAVEVDTMVAVRDACSLQEVEAELEDRDLATDGTPLSAFHRLLVLAARVIPSQYRVVCVVDPMAWVNAVRGEVWRAAVVRASVGRTAIWITADRDLAARADQVLELRNGSLRPTG
jgi:predicted ABC-type transport system involved in lysophospholipase L1 biosynthesis ATPase subunit